MKRTVAEWRTIAGNVGMLQGSEEVTGKLVADINAAIDGKPDDEEIEMDLSPIELEVIAEATS